MRDSLSHALIRISKKILEVHPVDRFLLISKNGEGKFSDRAEEDFESYKCHMMDLPTLRQSTLDTCGPVAVQLILEYHGIDARERDLDKALKVGPSGTSVENIVKYLKSEGFKVEAKEGSTIDEIKGLVDDGVPSIVDLQAWPDKPSKGWEDGWGEGHYAVAVGYTDKHVIFSDPSSIYDTYLTYEELDRRWHDTDGKIKLDHYVIIPRGKRPVYLHNHVIHMD
jgi:predicted double-glycine peptidase